MIFSPPALSCQYRAWIALGIDGRAFALQQNEKYVVNIKIR